MSQLLHGTHQLCLGVGQVVRNNRVVLLLEVDLLLGLLELTNGWTDAAMGQTSCFIIT